VSTSRSRRGRLGRRPLTPEGVAARSTGDETVQRFAEARCQYECGRR
jgi:hypothetical protein